VQYLSSWTWLILLNVTISSSIHFPENDIFAIVSFAMQKLFNLMQSYLSILDSISWVIGFPFRRSLSMPLSWSILSVLFCSSFKDSGLTLRSQVHFSLIFVQGERYGSSFSLLHVNIQFSQNHLLKRFYFLPYRFLTPVLRIK
jgi:hypothetical protein